MSRDKTLVPIDFTGGAYEVVATAADIAGRLGNDVVLLYVVKLPAGLPPGARLHPHGSPGAVDAPQFLDDDARAHLDPFALIFQAAGCSVEITLEHGEVSEAILAACARIGAGMIIMGTHGRRGLRRLVEGSVAEQVIRRADCPVLVVRTKKPDDHPGLSEAQEQALAESSG